MGQDDLVDQPWEDVIADHDPDGAIFRQVALFGFSVAMPRTDLPVAAAAASGDLLGFISTETAANRSCDVAVAGIDDDGAFTRRTILESVQGVAFVQVVGSFDAQENKLVVCITAISISDTGVPTAEPLGFLECRDFHKVGILFRLFDDGLDPPTAAYANTRFLLSIEANPAYLQDSPGGRVFIGARPGILTGIVTATRP